MQFLIVYSVNVSLVVTAFSELAQFFQYVFQVIIKQRRLEDRTPEHRTLELRRQEH